MYAPWHQTTLGLTGLTEIESVLGPVMSGFLLIPSPGHVCHSVTLRKGTTVSCLILWGDVCWSVQRASLLIMLQRHVFQNVLMYLWSILAIQIRKNVNLHVLSSSMETQLLTYVAFQQHVKQASSLMIWPTNALKHALRHNKPSDSQPHDAA